MRRLLIVFLLVLLPLRGWAAEFMALGLGSDTSNGASHALCPDHATPTENEDDAAGSVHAHCTVCQLPAMTAASVLALAPVLPAAQPAAPLAVLVEPAPKRQIKPPIA